MRTDLLTACMTLLLAACAAPGAGTGPGSVDRVAIAERWLRGIYGGDASVVDALASDDVVVSYPIFASVYGTPALRGRAAVRRLVAGFAKHWAEPSLHVDESIVAGDRVVLMWTFRARSLSSGADGELATPALHEWGGITLFRFDAAGRITAEIGEESEPGPARRLSAGSGG